MRMRDVGLVQETHLAAMDDFTLAQEFPHHDIYRSNLDVHKGGVLTLVRKAFAQKYYIEEIPLGIAAQGRILVLSFRSKEFPLDNKAHFNVANVYLSSGQGDMMGKEAQIATLAALDPQVRSLVGGDFNFVENEEDCSGELANCCLTGLAKRTWLEIKARLGLRDVHQETHTRFRRSKASPSSSRLDRFYSSTSEAESSLLAEHTYPVPTGSFWCRDHAGLHERLTNGELVPLVQGLSDHIPLALDLVPKTAFARGTADIPAWAALVPGYREAVKAEFGADDCDVDPFIELDRWKKVSRAVYKRIVQGKRALTDLYGGQVAKLTNAIRLLRLCAAGRPDHDQVEAIRAAHGYLRELVRRPLLDGDEYDTGRLEDFIDGLYGEGLREVALDQHAAGDMAFRPECYLPGAKGGDNFLAQLKTQLPCDRARLTSLRASITDVASADPSTLDGLVGGYYGGVWARDEQGAEGNEIGRYLRDFDKKVAAGTVPAIPDREELEDIIQKTNDSCSGPDGTPFACYREDGIVGGEVSAIIRRILVCLASGGRGPASFNKARLFLIAKAATLLVQDTRPISVTDAANRIIASCLAWALTPALQGYLESTQKGFCPGRVGTEHVHELTQEFYAALSLKKQHYLLSLDTARAFDCISHVFIRKLLPHIGLPSWVCQLVSGLLHKVTVVAAIAGADATPIPITRGVKQGCPFSPLLFILCFDVLLWRLDKVESLKAFAYADDLALTTPSPARLLQALALIRGFSRVSGLGLNVKKTVIVTTLPLTDRVRRALDRARWKAIQSAPHCVYLGVMVGAEVSTRDVFAKAIAKFNRRLAAYAPYLASASLHTRIVVANVFLLPLLYYLMQFYIAPYDKVTLPVQRSLHRMVVAFRGTSIAYAHIISERAAGGPFVPLRDVWATNVSMLAATHDLEESEGSPLPAMGFKGHIYWPLTQWKGRAMNHCMLPHGHAAFCAFALLEDYASRKHGIVIDLSALPSRAPQHAAKRRRHIYLLLADRAYDKPRRGQGVATSLDSKMGRFVEGNGLGSLFVSQAAAVANKLTPAVWNTQIRLMHNALPFERRRAAAHMEVERRWSVLTDSHYPCYFCGAGEDSAEHVFGDCAVVRTARDRMGAMLGCSLGHDFAVTLLAFPKLANPAVAIAIVCFNWAVWTERTAYLVALGYVPEPGAEVNRIMLQAQRRVPADKQNCSGRREASVADFARNPPLEATVAYTDGSAIPNPGPCGAGFVLRLQDQLTYSAYSQHLGMGDNNKGEMGAIYGALAAVDTAIADGAIALGSILLCFSDSALCIAYLDKGWAFSRWKVLAHATRALLRNIRKKMTVVLYWIRGHAGIPGNEEADAAAKIGAAPGPTGDADDAFTLGRSGFYLEGQGTVDPEDSDQPSADKNDGPTAPDRSMGPPLPRPPRSPAGRTADRPRREVIDAPPPSTSVDTARNGDIADPEVQTAPGKGQQALPEKEASAPQEHPVAAADGRHTDIHKHNQKRPPPGGQSDNNHQWTNTTGQRNHHRQQQRAAPGPRSTTSHPAQAATTTTEENGPPPIGPRLPTPRPEGPNNEVGDNPPTTLPTKGGTTGSDLRPPFGRNRRPEDLRPTNARPPEPAARSPTTAVRCSPPAAPPELRRRQRTGCDSTAKGDTRPP